VAGEADGMARIVGSIVQAVIASETRTINQEKAHEQ
jgi:hypothetical protein